MIVARSRVIPPFAFRKNGKQLASHRDSSEVTCKGSALPFMDWLPPNSTPSLK